MSRESSHKIEIDVQSQYIEDQSRPGDDHYVFAYTVTIRNNGSVAARLMGRHWTITDADGGVQDVYGDGVIGQQPFLKPGEDFSYTSGTALKTPVGSMQGSYQMRSEKGEHFDAPIPPFSLASPKILH
ncbi:MAG: Co2+/Mg2+ efflux protein ApaG [Candidatus Sedimenticola sp. (ex Thyasira tokunagai)]